MSETSDGHKGIGIGLSICKTIIQAHNGEITASNHSQGAEFTFTLPKERRIMTMTKCSVLIIEDEKIYRLLWEKYSNVMNTAYCMPIQEHRGWK